MKAMLGLVVITALLSVPAASGRLQGTYVDQGLLVASYATRTGGAAIVVLSTDLLDQPLPGVRLLTNYIPGDGQPAFRDEEVFLSWPGLPDKIITSAQGPYVHVTLNWISHVETPVVYHYRWTLPYLDQVAEGHAINQLFLPMLEIP